MMVMRPPQQGHEWSGGCVAAGSVSTAPRGEGGTRDMFEDKQSRVWYDARPYFKVGYLCARGQRGRAWAIAETGDSEAKRASPTRSAIDVYKAEPAE